MKKYLVGTVILMGLLFGAVCYGSPNPDVRWVHSTDKISYNIDINTLKFFDDGSISVNLLMFDPIEDMVTGTILLVDGETKQYAFYGSIITEHGNIIYFDKMSYNEAYYQPNTPVEIIYNYCMKLKGTNYVTL